MRIHTRLLRSIMLSPKDAVKPIALAALSAAAAMLILVSCNAEEPTPVPTPTPTPSPTPTPTPTTVALTVEEVLQRVEQAIDTAGSLSFILDHENGSTEILNGLQLTRVEGQVNEVGIYVKAQADLGRLYVEIEAILIDDETWLTNPLTGQWERLPIEDNPISFLQPIVAISNVVSGITEASLTAETPPDDYSISARVGSEALAPLIGDVKVDGSAAAAIVVDRDTFNIESVTISGPIQASDPDGIVRILQISGYGQIFEIKAPN